MTFLLTLLGGIEAVKSMVLLSALFLGLGGTVLWIWALIDCSKQTSSDPSHNHRQLVWLLVVALTHMFGALLYFIFGRASLMSSRSAIPASTPQTMARAAAAPPSVSPQPTSRPKAQCPKCGGPLGPDAPEGLCPRCLLQMNLGAPTQFTGESGARFTTNAPPPPMPPEEIAQHFPQLEILECLGRGGMGVVYKARQPRLNRLVALKILAPGRQQDPQFAERFLREAQALAKLNHPNIVTVYDFGESDGLYYLLMEYVDGVTLRGLLQGGKVESGQALAIVPRICEALQYAHEQGVVHRDIKPENVLLDKQGRVKIADFGIARMLGVEGLPAHTRDRYVIGTPYYMAPEQVEHPLEVDHRADIYSLGVVFYEMLTGELPLGRFALPSQKVQLDVRLDDVVLRTLEKEPQRRYQQAGQVKTDVEHITGVGTSGGSPIPGVALGAPPRPPTPPPVAPPRGGFAANPPGESRFSGKAIAGIVWAALGATTLMLIGHSGVVFPRDFHLLALIFVFTFLAAPLGTTILGWAAVGDIRRSNGKIHGLWLAVFDGLLFPIIALSGLILFMCFVAERPILDHFAQFASNGLNRQDFMDFHRLDFLAPGIFLSLIADILIIWLVARAVHRVMHPAPAEPASLLWGMMKALAVIVILAIVATVVFAGVGLLSYNGMSRQFLATAEHIANKDSFQTVWNQAVNSMIQAVNAKLPDYSLRYDNLHVFWAPEMNRATIVLDNAQEMMGVNGTNAWKSVDGSLYATYTGDGMWTIQGDGHLGNVQFQAPGPDTGQPLPEPVGQPQAALFPAPASANASASADDIDSLRVELQQAQHNLDNVKQKLDQGLAVLADVINAQEVVDVLDAEINGGPVQIAQAHLDAAQHRLANDEQLLRAGLITQADYDQAKAEVDARKAEADAAQGNNQPVAAAANGANVPSPAAITVPDPPGYTVTSASSSSPAPSIPDPPAYVAAQAAPDTSVAVEIDAIKQLNFENSRLVSLLNIARRPNLSPASQVRLVQTAFSNLDFENNKIALLLEIIRNPKFSEQARTAILSRIGSLNFENSRVVILNFLNQHPATAPAAH